MPDKLGATTLLRDSLVVDQRRLAAAVSDVEAWGGRYATASGTVTVYVSSRYPESSGLGQRWADFLAGLLHGTELARVTVYMLAPDEIPPLCGEAAQACYSPASATIVSPAEDEPDLSAEATLAHEYGHHVAANRSNEPWPALAWGTKRWASHEQVCRGARRHDVFPGAQAGLRYRYHPREGVGGAERLRYERRRRAP